MGDSDDAFHDNDLQADERSSLAVQALEDSVRCDGLDHEDDSCRHDGGEQARASSLTQDLF